VGDDGDALAALVAQPVDIALDGTRQRGSLDRARQNDVQITDAGRREPLQAADEATDRFDRNNRQDEDQRGQRQHERARDERADRTDRDAEQEQGNRQGVRLDKPGLPGKRPDELSQDGPRHYPEGPEQDLEEARRRKRLVPTRFRQQPGVVAILAGRSQRDVRMSRRARVALPDQDLARARERLVVADLGAGLAPQEPAVQPGDERFAEVDERRTDAVVAGAMDEQHAEARRDDLFVGNARGGSCRRGGGDHRAGL
jgi:hypothetical protein